MANKTITKTKSTKKPVKMTAAQKRVAIARDAIKWLDARKIKMTPGIYFELLDGVKITDLNGKLDEFLAKDVKEPCRVCALGGIFYSMVRRFDRVSVSIGDIDGLGDGRAIHLIGISDFEMVDELRRYFSAKQLGLIESAFERSGMCFRDDQTVSDDELDRAIAFGNEVNDPAKRMRAIMRNIIENDGTFCP